MTSRVWLYNVLLRVLVYILPLPAFGISAYLALGGVYIESAVRQHYLILLLFTVFLWTAAAEHYKVSSVADLFWEYTGIRAAFLACSSTFLLQAALLLFLPQLRISRAFILTSDVVLFLMVVGIRNFFRLTSISPRWPRKCERILVVGSDQYARRYVKLLRRIPFFHFQIQGYVQLPGQPVLVDDAPVISGLAPLRLDRTSFDEVVIALPAERYLQLPNLVDNLRNLGRPIRAVLDLGPRLSLRDKLFQAGRLQMMNLEVSPTESFAYTVLKRAFDLIAATLGLMVLSPLLLGIAVLVKLSSPGPVLFRQERVGRGGRPFVLLKFRTMHCSSRDESDTVWTTKDDPRCTRLGTVLRRFCLDELPQLLNVIQGEMSLVGPRPERPYFVAKFQEDIEKYDLRHSCQVGMTGWAQVNGLRGDTSIRDRLQYDLYYMHNWSFGMDLQIIARTAIIALTDKNGY
jgi:exopolysaccharide biosynthesis polyprenyl glycosylphosphotransferase